MRLFFLVVMLAPLGVFAACSSFTSSDAPTTPDGGDDAIAADGAAVDVGVDVDTGPGSGASDAYAAVILGDSPIGYWRMNDPSGPRLNDATRNNNALLLDTGSLTRVPGITQDSADRGVFFNDPSGGAMTQGAKSAPDAFKSLDLDFTVECWIKPQVMVASGKYQELWQRITYLDDPKADASTHRMGVLLYLTGEQIVLERDDGLALASAHANLPTTTDYTYVVAEHSGGTLRVYLSGILDVTSTQPDSTFAQPPGAVFAVGSEVLSQSAGYTGIIDEVAVYDHALTENQITTHYNARKAH